VTPADGDRPDAPGEDRRSWLEAALGAVTEVRAGEGVTALLLTTNIFILLTAYYVIKPVREALIGVLEGGAEYASYSSAAIAITLLFAVPLYSAFASRVRRNRLVVTVTLFFASHLVLFFLGSMVDVARGVIGIVFFIWVGIFNMMVVAQFWAFANDLYAEEQGKRLFPLVGIGASVGAAVGSGLSKLLVSIIGVYPMLLVAAAMLVAFGVLIQVIHVREVRRRDASASELYGDDSTSSSERQPRSKPFGMVFRHRYLTYLAAFALVFTFVNTNGEYMLRSLVNDAAAEQAGSGMTEQQFIGQFWGDFYFYVNIVGLLLQSFVVSRLVRFLGLPFTFYILPTIALFNAAAVAFIPILAVLRVGKIAENATDYSVNNTVRNMLWLPTTSEMKYNAKQAVDTFFVRMGDVASAGLVLVGAELLGWTVRWFAVGNILLIAGWCLLGVGIFRQMENMRRIQAEEEGREVASA
jgi:AAA family ATP:ADP antiporter